MQRIPLLIAALLLAPLMARAQVELVYKTPTEALMIKGLENKMPVYEKDGRLVPIPDEGDFAIRLGGAYADLSAESFARYSVKIELGNFMKPGGMTVKYGVSLADPGREIKALDVYYVCLWQTPGKITQALIMPLRPTDRGLYEGGGDFLIGPDETKGFLRVYFFAGGKLIRGISRKEVKSGADFSGFRLAVDGGDRAAVQAWAKAHPDAVLSKSLMQSLVQWGDAEALAAVLGRGPAANKLRGEDGGYMLNVAILAGRSEAVAQLLQQGVKADRPAGGIFPVQLAVEAGSLGILQQLVQAGANVNAKAYAFGRETTLLSLALRTGKVELLDYLAAHGAKWPSSREELAQWAMGAVYDGWSGIFERLIQQGADPDYKDAGTPLLMDAILSHRAEMARTLIAHGAKVDATDTWQATALMAAAAMGDTALADDLLKAGASLQAKNRVGNTAAAYAIRGGHPDLARALVERYEPDKDDWAHLFAAAILSGDEAAAKWVGARTSSVAYEPKETEDLMCGAIRLNLLEVVRGLIEKGVKVNGVVRGDWNFAGVAERYERVEILKLFQAQLGGSLTAKRPPVAKLPAKQFDLVPVPVPPEVLEHALYGEARVEIYLDANGVPAFPLLRSSSNPRIDSYAVQTVMRSVFNRVGGGAWRRVIVPVSFYPNGPGGSDGIVYRAWSLDAAPGPVESRAGAFEFLKVPNPEARLSLVDLTVDRTGAVSSSAVVAGNSEATDGAVLAAVRQLAFNPGKKAGKAVSCAVRGAWLMPQNRYLSVDTVRALEELQAGDRLPKVLKRDRPEAQVTAKSTGPQAVLLLCTITSAGKAENIRVIATTNRDAAVRAVERCAATLYAPAQKAGVAAAMEVVQCLTEDAWEDQFYVN